MEPLTWSIACFRSFKTKSEDEMADDLSNRGGQDRSRISTNEDHEVRYWTETLGVSREQLQRAVDRVGNSAAAVRKELGK